jgi:hypothetical protein
VPATKVRLLSRHAFQYCLGHRPDAPASLLDWPRLRFTILTSTVLGVFLSLPMETTTYIVVIRAVVVGLSALLAFSVFERWPARESKRIPRWVLQLAAIVAVVPLAAALAYWLTTGGHPRFAEEEKRVVGYMMLTFMGIFFAPWIALGAMLRQREAFAHEARRSTSAQSARTWRDRRTAAPAAGAGGPHFLFNTPTCSARRCRFAPGLRRPQEPDRLLACSSAGDQ